MNQTNAEVLRQTRTKTSRKISMAAGQLSFLPGPLRHALKKLAGPDGLAELRFHFSGAERKVLRRKKKIRCSSWASRHRVIKKSRFPGRWRNEVTPYLVGIMDACFFPSVREAAICKGPQTGGSEAILNCLGYIISRQPGEVLMTYPDELTARDNARDRIIPMIQAAPELRQYFTGLSNDASNLRVGLLSMAIHMAWSGSPARLANKPIRYVVREEIDKWKDVKAEASSMDLAETRTTTWDGKQLVLDVCTPTTEGGAIWVEMNKGNAIFDYWVRCPHCAHWQLMAFEGILFDREAKAYTVLNENSAQYLCANLNCGALWPDADRDRAVRLGEWRERDSGLELFAHLEAERPRKIGFHLPSWLSRFVSLSRIAAAWLDWNQEESAEKKLAKLKNFKNRYCAAPWVDVKVDRSKEQILSHCDDRPRGRVPSPEVLPDGKTRDRVAALLCGVDTQDNHLRYVIRAFGYGEAQESWLVQCGILSDFTALRKLLFQTEFHDANDRAYSIMATMQDAMGHRTYDVYKLCVAHRGLVFPWKGDGRLSAPVRFSKREYYPGTKIPIPGGLNLLRCDTYFFKSMLTAKLAVHPGDPGAFHLHAGIDADSNAALLDEYAAEMAAEYFDHEKLSWICPKGVANHYWDCEVMLQALAWHLNIRNKKHPQSSGAAHKRPAPPPPPRGRGLTAAERIAAARR